MSEGGGCVVPTGDAAANAEPNGAMRPCVGLGSLGQRGCGRRPSTWSTRPTSEETRGRLSFSPISQSSSRVGLVWASPRRRNPMPGLEHRRYDRDLGWRDLVRPPKLALVVAPPLRPHLRWVHHASPRRANLYAPASARAPLSWCRRLLR